MADIFLQTIDLTEDQKSIEVLESNDESLKEKEENDSIIDSEEENIIDGPRSLQFMMTDMVELTNSEFIHHRQLAVKKLLNCFQLVDTNKEYQQHIIAIMCKLSEDEESLVRSELVGHIPSIALYCQNHSPEMKKVIRQQLVPYTVKLLNDPQIAVRKLSQSALLVLLENNLINEAQLTEWICPLVSQLPMCESNSEDLRVEDVTMMTRMVQLVKKDIAVEFFLEPYISLCCDPAFGIRRICAMGFGALTKIVGTDITEHSLLPAFLNLCNDDRWGVKKACADVFVDVASVVTMKTRMDILSHIFMNLLNDCSRYVKFAAYQSLGGFIYTFSLPDEPNENNSFLKETKSDCSVSSTNKPSSNIWDRRKNVVASDQNIQKPDISLQKSADVSSLHNNESSQNNLCSGAKLSNCDSADTHLKNGDCFNAFQFWRDPILEIGHDIATDVNQLINGDVRVQDKKVPFTSLKVRQKMKVKPFCASLEDPEVVSTSFKDPISPFIIHAAYNDLLCKPSYASLEDDSEVVRTSFKDSVLSFDTAAYDDLLQSAYNSVVSTDSLSSKNSSASEALISTPYDQNIVPGFLLNKFCLFYDDPDSLDNKQCGDERAVYCAYNFPAVAKALGKEYWPCIRNVCHLLARDVEWTVRRTVASYLHELAIFLGHDITHVDLLPLFLGLMHDVDEVRIKLVVNMAEFLKCLDPSDRTVFLPSIEKFFEIDNERNWRFRFALAEHMKPVLELYSARHVVDHFVVLGIVLLTDKFYAVRQAAVQLMASMVCKIYRDADTRPSSKTILDKLYFMHFISKKWRGRQQYIMLADEIAKQQCLPVDVFMEEIMQNLHALASDKVPNVRLALCRLIVLTLFPLGYLSLEDPKSSEHTNELNRSMVSCLIKDTDKDVQQFAVLLPKIECPSTPDLPDPDSK